MENQKRTNNMQIDKAVFIPATAITLAFGILFFIYPKQSNDILNKIHAFTTNELGWFFLLFTVAMLGICLYYAFSKMGNIVLGDENSKPEYSTFTWLGMILTSGTGGSLLYLSSIEWMWIMQSPPLGLEPGSVQAAEWASTYGMFHWGPSAWAMYMAVAIPIGYFFFVKKKGTMKMSEYARPLIGKNADGIVGHTLNFFYIFALLGGVLTSLALGTPAISSGIANIIGLESTNVVLDTIVIMLWTFIPLGTLVLGLQKGFSRLSDLNVKLFGVLLALILVFGPTSFILNQSTDSLGRMINNFFSMSLSTETIGGTGFPQAWPIFYMSWWAVYALPFGLFIAKISKGRTIRETVLGGLGAGSLGCMIFYMIIPNFGLHLQLTGVADLTTVLAEQGRGGVVIEMFSHAPGGFIMVILFTVLVLMSYITGHVSVGYSLAAACEKNLDEDQEPQKWNMTFWLILAGAVSLALYLLNPDALQPLQTVSIITGFPICIAMAIIISSFLKQIKMDFPEGVPVPETSKDKIYGKAEKRNIN